MRDAVLLAGAGRFAHEVTDIAVDAGIAVVGWIEGLDPNREDPAHDPPIYWEASVAALDPRLAIVPAIGSVQRLRFIRRLEAGGRALRAVIHPSAHVARTAIIEPGVVIFPGVIVGAETRIERGTIVNRGALIGHHTIIGAHGFVGPGANIAGGVRIGPGVMIGMGALIRDDREVGEGAVIGMGSVVITNVAAGVTALGNPARARVP